MSNPRVIADQSLDDEIEVLKVETQSILSNPLMPALRNIIASHFATVQPQPTPRSPQGTAGETPIDG